MKVQKVAIHISIQPIVQFIAIFTSHRSPLSERLEQATRG